jgi:hypothetical protein
VDTAGEDVDHPKILAPGDENKDSFNVMSIKTRDFRFQSVKKVEGKDHVEDSKDEDLPQFDNKKV